MKYIFLFIALFGYVLEPNSQTTEFGSITKENLQEDRYELDLTAHSSVLYKKEVHFYKFRRGIPYAMTLIHERIKFYDLLDLEFASKTIFLNRTFEESETLQNFRAQTYNLVDDKIEITKVDIKDIKKENLRDVSVLSFKFPEVKSGSIIEYTYLKESPMFWNKDEIICQYRIPIRSLDITVESIDEVSFKQHVIGTHPMRVNAFDKDSLNASNRNVKKSNGEVLTVYRASNIPRITNEPYSDNINNHVLAIIFELQFLDVMGQKEKLVQTWNDVGKNLIKSREYRKCLNRDGYFDDEIDAVVAGVEDPMEKVRKVMGYLQNRITWDGELSKTPTYGCPSAYKNKEGNSADINLLFISMLQYLGIKAYPVALSTTDNFTPLYPFEGFLNYVIASVVIGGERHLIDVSDKKASIDLMSLQNYNGRGLLLNNDDDTYHMIPLEMDIPSKSVFIVNMEVNPLGQLKGSLESKLNNYEARYFEYDYERLGKKEFVVAQETLYDDIKIKDFSVEGIKGNSETITQLFNFETTNSLLGLTTSEDLQFYPLSFLRLRDNPFINDFRISPIYFGYPKLETYNINIDIPEGYEVESLPSSVVLRLPDNKASYRFQVKEQQNKLLINSSLKIDQSTYDVRMYATIKEFFQQMVDKQNEMVVLKKIAK